MTPHDEDCRLNSPPLQGRGRGWGLSANAIARLHGHAADMRRDPTEPEKRLWGHLSRAQLAGFKFRRQAAIGRHIVDFLCPRAGLIVEVDGDTHLDPAADARRDAALADQGYRTVRVSNIDVMRNVEGVLQHILDALRESPLPFRGGAGGGASQPNATPGETPHPNPSPEGERLKVTDTPKLLGIGLEGSGR